MCTVLVGAEGAGEYLRCDISWSSSSLALPLGLVFQCSFATACFALPFVGLERVQLPSRVAGAFHGHVPYFATDITLLVQLWAVFLQVMRRSTAMTLLSTTSFAFATTTFASFTLCHLLRSQGFASSWQ